MDHTYISLPYSEILPTIHKASLFGGKLSHPTPDQNEIFHIQAIDIDSYGTMFIKLHEKIDIEHKWPVSVMLNYRNICFQIEPEQYSIEDNVLVGALPHKVRALPMRPDERYVLPLHSQVETCMYRIEKRGGSVDLTTRVLDLSRAGMAVLVKDVQEDDLLLRNDHLWIREINGIALDQPIFARVVYTAFRKYKDTVDLKAGLSLEGNIPEAIFKKLQSMCSLILTA